MNHHKMSLEKIKDQTIMTELEIKDINISNIR